MKIRKIYKVCIVGTANFYFDINPLFRLERNVIETNKEKALEYCAKDFDRILSKTAKFNFKETIKLFILDILGLKSFNVSFNIEKGRVENDR